MNIKKAIICSLSVIMIWSLYAVLITLIVPDIPLRSKLFMAVAFSIPSVISVGSVICKESPSL